MKIKACEKCGYAAATPFFDGYIPLPDLPHTDASRKEYGLPPKTDGSRGGLTICKACQDKAIAMRKPRNSSGGGYQPLEEKEIVRPTAQQETVQERAAQQRVERQEEFRYTAEDEARWSRNRERVIAEREAEKLKILNEGVFVWTESKGTGHSLISVHKDRMVTIFSYGRYDDISITQVVGEGVLVKLQGEHAKKYIENELYRVEAKVFKVLDCNASIVEEYFNNLWNGSHDYPNSDRATPTTKMFGKVIDTYDLSGNNCTTHSVDAIKASGSKLFNNKKLGVNYSEDFMIPSSLETYMLEVSRSFDMKAENVTNQMKLMYPNINGIVAMDKAGNGEEALGVLGDSSGYAGSSSGYSGGTLKGVLGSSYE